MAFNESKTPDDVRAAFDNGTVITASKMELEQLLLANGSSRILHPANQSRASEMGETMRQLLAARQSQELHDKATRIAIIALIVSLAALACSVIQAYFAFVGENHASTSPPAIGATQSLPIR